MTTDSIVTVADYQHGHRLTFKTHCRRCRVDRVILSDVQLGSECRGAIALPSDWKKPPCGNAGCVNSVGWSAKTRSD